MHSCHFAKSFIERGLGRFCSGRAFCRFIGCVAAGHASFATTISTRFWQWRSVRSGCLGRNTKCCKLRIRPSNSTSTPGRHDGFFFFRTLFVLFVEAPVFCLRRVYSLPITGWVVIYFSPFLRVSIPSLARVCYDSGECTTAFVLWFALQFFCSRFIFYWRCHFVQESFGVIFAEGAYAPGDLV